MLENTAKFYYQMNRNQEAAALEERAKHIRAMRPPKAGESR
jgi:hypothetical protein